MFQKHSDVSEHDDKLKQMQESLRKQEERMHALEKENARLEKETSRKLNDQKKLFTDRELMQKELFDKEMRTMSEGLRAEAAKSTEVSPAPAYQPDIIQLLTAMQRPLRQQVPIQDTCSSHNAQSGLSGMLISALLKSHSSQISAQNSQISKLEKQLEDASQARLNVELHNFLNYGYSRK